MNYELAKKLKDAGYSQEYRDGKFYEKNGKFAYGPKGRAIYFPTLSELIEACGESFALLERASTGLWVSDYHDKELNCHTEQGSTPEEAVANLWLALNRHV